MPCFAFAAVWLSRSFAPSGIAYLPRTVANIDSRRQGTGPELAYPLPCPALHVVDDLMADAGIVRTAAGMTALFLFFFLSGGYGQ